MSFEIFDLIEQVPDFLSTDPHDLIRNTLPIVRRCALPDARILWISWCWLSFKVDLPYFVEDACVRARLNEDNTQVTFLFAISGSLQGVERRARFNLHFAVPPEYR